MKYKVKYVSYELKDATDEKVSAPETLYEIVKDTYNPIVEEMHLLIMNIKNKVIDRIMVGKGTHGTIQISPRDIFVHVLKANGIHFALSHCHPSGDTEPSKEDIIFTRKIAEAAQHVGLSFIDHLIITPTDFFSFKKNMLI